MHLNLSADEVLTTTRAVRKRLDFERDVPREVLMECVDIALQAPSGSNRQGWQFMFVTDPAKKQAIADLYRGVFEGYINMPGAEYEDGDTRADRMEFVRGSASYLAEHMHEAPVLFIPLHEGRLDNLPNFMGASAYGSIIPAMWSFMLAARERGLGTAFTTLHLPKEQEAAEILGIPYDSFTQIGLIPVAYTRGTDFKVAQRQPAADLTHWDTW